MVILKPMITGLVVLILLLISCNESPLDTENANAVESDKNALAIIYAAGDNANSVTKDVGLPASGASGTSISWVTSKSSVITIEGVVTRPDSTNGDATVTLTATISKGTASDVKVFVLTVIAKGTILTGIVTDIDGNVYKTVKIGNQEWMAENLRVTRYNDGTLIPHVPDSAAWEALTTPGYCYYNNATHADTIKKWGALYNWYVVSPTNSKKIAPAGWHVPSDSEWTVLEKYMVLNGYNWDGSTDTSDTAYNKIAKSLASKTDWLSSTSLGAIGNDLTTNNRSGFSALPGGYRMYGAFRDRSDNGYWWSTTEHTAYHAYLRHLIYNEERLCKYYNYKFCGYSVRLLRD